MKIGWKRAITMGSFIACLLGLVGSWLACPHASAWDGDWTNAKSGRNGPFDNPGTTDGQAGTDPPQKYYTPAQRDFADVDPEELDDYFKRRDKNYSPYALARITQDLHYYQQVVPKGYYLIKPGDPNDGSARVNLGTLNGAPPPQAGLVQVANAPVKKPVQVVKSRVVQPNPDATVPAVGTQTITPATATPPARKSKEPVYQVLVIKRQGKVVLVVPIHRKQLYIPARKDKIPNRALAWVEQEDRHPVLKFYYHHWIYSTDFE